MLDPQQGHNYEVGLKGSLPRRPARRLAGALPAEAAQRPAGGLFGGGDGLRRLVLLHPPPARSSPTASTSASPARSPRAGTSSPATPTPRATTTTTGEPAVHHLPDPPGQALDHLRPAGRPLDRRRPAPLPERGSTTRARTRPLRRRRLPGRAARLHRGRPDGRSTGSPTGPRCSSTSRTSSTRPTTTASASPGTARPTARRWWPP